MNQDLRSTPHRVVAVDGRCTLGREDIGGKAWGVNRIAALGLPVPPAFVITTAACRDFFAHGHVLDETLWSQIIAHMRELERHSGRTFGGRSQPLLVSVRSGAAHSMPGMMDTVLDLGMHDAVERALALEAGGNAHARDTRRRFIEQYRKVVQGGQSGPVPDDPWDQLRTAVAAVFESWRSPRAQAYRRNRGLSDGDGTAVMIQTMVFGNADAHSGTGVLFSRSPISGNPPPWGEWLTAAQGEDVVSGARTPLPLSALRDSMPDVFEQLMHAAAVLERDARDIQDIEFTVESRQLWLLQTRAAKRSPQAALRAAVAFAEEGTISRAEAVLRLNAEQVRQLPALALTPEAQPSRADAAGEGACPGVACGIVVVDPVEAEARARRGDAVILARPNTSPEDLQGVLAAVGVMTEHGGATSHAAVVCRELGRPCVVGCGPDTVTRLAGLRVTLDGGSGRIWRGEWVVDRSDEHASDDVRRLIAWGMPLVGIALLRPDDAPPDALDLDLLNDAWRSALRSGIVVRGRILETDEGARAARAADVAGMVVRHRLPALLTLLAADTAQLPVQNPLQTDLTLDGDADELTLLRLVALKGRPSLEILAESLALPVDGLASYYRALHARGLCSEPGPPVRLTAAGQERMKALLATERAQADAESVRALYAQFVPLNAELKRIMTAWQTRGDGALNDHSDPAYDAATLQRLAALHRQSETLLHRLAALAPRLGRYAFRLSRAAARIAAGERSYVARIMADSYHTVWFELHEELIGLAGLTRAQLGSGSGSA